MALTRIKDTLLTRWTRLLKQPGLRRKRSADARERELREDSTGSEKIMEIENSKNYEMNKRRELMADGRRYIIYYTFGENPDASAAETNAGTQKAEDEAKKSET